MPPASRLLRLLGFAVPAALTLAGVQPLLGAATGSVGPGWAFQLTAPAIAAAAVLFVASRRFDRGDVVQPPWYSAWLLLPGAFLLAGAASMWALVGAGTVAWAGAIAVVGRASR